MKNKSNSTNKKCFTIIKQQPMKKILTPFEIHINKNKQNVLGRKSKADQGLPGVARTKAIAKRKNTLLLEYKLKDKDNIFLDRRIGEKNFNMTEEDKVMARFAVEKIKSHKKKNIFNLNDEEVLTHRGQSLIDIEKYDNPRSDEDEYSDEENKIGKLEKKFVQDAHFGGGILSKSSSGISRKELIDQLIADSKKRKADRQKIREETMDLTTKLDSEWHDLLPLVSSSNKSLKIEENFKPDDYDIALRELKYEARGTPSDKLKSEEVIAKEEESVLDKLEQNRLTRMKGFSNEMDFQKKHKSADDLDNFQIEKIEDNNEKIAFINYKKIGENNNININLEESSDEIIKSSAESEDEVEDESEDQLDNSFSDINNSNFSDSEKDSEDKKCTNVKRVQISEKIILKKSRISNKKYVIDDSKSDIDMKDTAEMSDKICQELSSTFKVPTTYEELLTLIKHHSPSDQSNIIQKIIKCNHWKLSDKNKDKLSNLFSLLLQYLNECTFVNSQKEFLTFFQIFDRLCPYLYDLIHANPEKTKNCLKDILKDKYNNFENKIKIYPKLDTLILFKLVSIAYPTSDFRHQIVTPCLVFMSQILFKCKIKGKHDISKGLFLSSLILEYTILSKRWSPSVINFLRQIIFISLPKPFLKLNQVLLSFNGVNKNSNLLVLKKNLRNLDIDPVSFKMQIEDLSTEEINDDYKLRTFLTTLNLLYEFKEQCKELDAANSIFEPILYLFKYGSVERYPKKVQEKVQIFVEDLEKLKNKKLNYLVFNKKRPKALKMYEPRIEVIHDGKKRKPMSKTKAEKEKLVHKLKKETKSAIREVRRDNIFLSKVKLKQQIVNDTERKRKIKEIFSDAAIQQSELKKFKK